MIGGHWKQATFSTSNSVHFAEMVGRPTNAAQTRKKNLARARQIRLEARQTPPEPISPNPDTPENGEADNESSGDEVECTGWSGGVAHYVSSSDEPIVISDDESEEEFVEELSGSELEEVARKCLGTPEAASKSSAEPSVHSAIMHKQTKKDWKKAESRRSLGYNGQSERTKRHHVRLAQEKEKEDAKLRSR